MRYDHKRGCGWRKPGGTYLVSDGLMAACGKLPVALSVCPTCHGGIKPSRSWMWVDVDVLLKDASCPHLSCGGCPLAQPMGRAGLIWIGEKFYQRPEEFLAESNRLGISRRIPAVPHEFVLGETWVLVAHRKVPFPCPAAAPHDVCPDCGGTKSVEVPGIFQAFKPVAMEYVVRGDETDEELARKVQRGITPVTVQRLDEPARLIDVPVEVTMP